MAKQIHERIRGGKWMKIRRIVLSANPLCVMCQRKGRAALATIVDHITALVNGGTNDMDNLQGLCTDCHETKTRKDLGQREQVETGVDGWPIS